MNLADFDRLEIFKNAFPKKGSNLCQNDDFWEDSNRYFDCVDYQIECFFGGRDKELTAKELIYILYFSPELEKEKTHLSSFTEIFERGAVAFDLSRVGFQSLNAARAFYYILQRTDNGSIDFVTLSMKDFVEEGGVKKSHYFLSILNILELGIININGGFHSKNFRNDITVGITFYFDYENNKALTF